MCDGSQDTKLAGCAATAAYAEATDPAEPTPPKRPGTRVFFSTPPYNQHFWVTTGQPGNTCV